MKLIENSCNGFEKVDKKLKSVLMAKMPVPSAAVGNSFGVILRI